MSIDVVAPELSEEEFTKFCEFFYRKTGILFESKKKYFVERRLSERIVKSNNKDFREYFLALRFEPGGEEMQSLVNAMTVNETYFFREDYQLKALIDGIMPEITGRKRRGESVRVWSMPCSSGEEPYSLAIAMLEFWSDVDHYEVEILASDIDSSILTDARAGIFSERSLQRLPSHLLSKYFTRFSADKYKISDDLRGSISFSKANIIDPMQMAHYRGLDVIFCRNLLIYFDDVSRREAVEALYDCLAPGGYVCLGHSESMSRISPLFQPRKFGEAIVYQKPIEPRR